MPVHATMQGTKVFLSSGQRFIPKSYSLVNHIYYEMQTLVEKGPLIPVCNGL
jgi:hypothetical protein